MVTPHKILFTGSIDAGKTTLLNHFSSHPQIYVVSETARELLSLNPALAVKPEFQDILFQEQLRREEEAIRSGKPIIICDRGVFDIVAFSTILSHPVKKEWKESLPGRYQSVALFSITDIPFDVSTYTLNLEIAQQRERIDQTIRRIVRELACPILEISGVHSYRVAILSQYVDSVIFGEGHTPRIEEK